MRPIPLSLALVAASSLLVALPGPAYAASPAAPYDFDGDRRPDVVIPGPQLKKKGGRQGVVAIRYAKAGRKQVLYGRSSIDLASADFDADGYADLAIADPDDGGIHVHHGSAKGLRKDADFLSTGTTNVFEVDAGDVDADGRPDLLFFAGNRFGVFSGAPPGTPPVLTKVSHQSVQPEVADFTGDGVDDVVITNLRWVPLLYAGGPDGMAEPVALTDLAQNRLTLAADINGDGRTDLLTRVRGALRVSLGVPGGFAKPQVLKGSSPGVPGGAWGSDSSFTVGDVNRDGRDDVVVGSRLNGQIRVLYGAKKGLTTKGAKLYTRKGVGGGAQEWPGFGSAVSLADVSGDRKPELLIGSPAEGKGRVYMLRNVKGVITASRPTRLTPKTFGLTGSSFGQVLRP
ncbi:FG-GAP and VCBS repeat-containing protein [Actinocorallia sp. A-T 12471]|uniref:FG-GAP repeat domain-containing protein n=1 Tax=Actinocorallia sp. A-T 12471 TaxID=3089813 RepID=UPI0029CD2ABD|nr:FG-GAP and VCBS repeat-containing protein [Actinocorallia sp. A-T 12471]MDX6742474.1 FG-GAP and VCBS repeat-containing protein [Actinocorallia sp. A-T 12471]